MWGMCGVVDPGVPPPQPAQHHHWVSSVLAEAASEADAPQHCSKVNQPTLRRLQTPLCENAVWGPEERRHWGKWDRRKDSCDWVWCTVHYKGVAHKPQLVKLSHLNKSRPLVCWSGSEDLVLWCWPTRSDTRCHRRCPRWATCPGPGWRWWSCGCWPPPHWPRRRRRRVTQCPVTRRWWSVTGGPGLTTGNALNYRSLTVFNGFKIIIPRFFLIIEIPDC